MEKIKNKHYNQFLKEGIIDILSEQQIEQALSNINGRYSREGRSLLITMYYTGARPAEVLELKPKDISKDGGKVLIKVIGVKRGLPRTLTLPSSRAMIKELYDYSTRLPADFYMFMHYRTKYKRVYLTKKGDTKTIIETSNKLRYYFNKWFNGVMEDPIPPYFLRHNRFSMFAEKGALPQDIQFWKGSKTAQSVMPYLHMSSATSKKMSKLL